MGMLKRDAVRKGVRVFLAGFCLCAVVVWAFENAYMNEKTLKALAKIVKSDKLDSAQKVEEICKHKPFTVSANVIAYKSREGDPAGSCRLKGHVSFADQLDKLPHLYFDYLVESKKKQDEMAGKIFNGKLYILYVSPRTVTVDENSKRMPGISVTACGRKLYQTLQKKREQLVADMKDKEFVAFKRDKDDHVEGIVYCRTSYAKKRLGLTFHIVYEDGSEEDVRALGISAPYLPETALNYRCFNRKNKKIKSAEFLGVDVDKAPLPKEKILLLSLDEFVEKYYDATAFMQPGASH